MFGIRAVILNFLNRKLNIDKALELKIQPDFFAMPFNCLSGFGLSKVYPYPEAKHLI